MQNYIRRNQRGSQGLRIGSRQNQNMKVLKGFNSKQKRLKNNYNSAGDSCFLGDLPVYNNCMPNRCNNGKSN